MSSDADLEAPVASVSDLHDDTLIGKARIYLAKIYRALKSLVGLAILLVLYSILGMAVFRMIEYPNEVEQRAKALEKKAEILQSMLNKTWMFNKIGETQWVEDTRALLASFEDIVRNMDYSSDTDENTWGWWSAFFYCTTIYTTIGYGSITPKTDLGRFVTILYALIGIPLALMVLAEVGKRFTVGLKFLWKFVRRYYYTGYCIKVRQQGKSYLDRGKTALRRASHRRRYRVNEDGKREEIPRTLYDKAPKDEKDEENPVANGHEPEDLGGSGSLCTLSVTSKESQEPDNFEVDENFNLPISIASTILLVYIMLGAIMYWFWEQWSFMESFYFVFISVSTIGFGDIVPDKQSYFIISSIYLFIGLSLVSMCVNVAIEYLNTTIDRAKVRMDKYRGKISEVGKEKMEQVGKQFDKAKVLAKSNFNEARMKATEMKTIARDKATEVRKDFISNVQKEVSKIKKKKKTSIDSNEREGSVPSPGPVRAKSEELYTDTSPSKQHSLDIPDKNISRSRSENVVIPPEQQVVNSVIES